MNRPSLRDTFKETPCADKIDDSIADYTEQFEKSDEEREKHAADLSQSYYNLATDFYEYGWGESFHFGARHRGESFAASLARHELYLAHRLGLQPGMKVLDLGSGVGGPMRTIARFSGAKIDGVNNCEYQIERARLHNRDAGMESLCDFLHCDWVDIPVESGSYDAAYAIETTCHAGDRSKLYREVFRALRDDASFAGYEWCLTSKYDPDNPQHREWKHGIEKGGGVANLVSQEQIQEAIRESGFEIVECRDFADECDAETPWYLPLKGEGLSLQTFRQGPVGRKLTTVLVAALEGVKVLPRGSSTVLKTLELCGNSLIRAGEAGIFTPMQFFLARKRTRSGNA